MSASGRDYAILWIEGVVAKKAAAARGTALGGGIITSTPQHKLDGPEHLAPEDTTTLDASTTKHGLMPKGSGNATDVYRGDLTQAALHADEVTYDNATSGLSATDVQAAIDEVASGATSPLTTKGDLHGFDTADARIPVGPDEADLIADSSDAQGVVWRPNRVTTTDPTVSDDSGDGYRAGSRWLNITSAEEFVCLDATAGAAVWKSTTAQGSGSLEVAEADGTPDVTGVTKIVVTNGKLTDDGSGQVTLDLSGGGGGGGSSGYDLDTYSLDATYGDDFTAASLNTSLWTRRNFTSGAETAQLGKNATYLRSVTTGRAAGDGYFQSAPAGDWTFAMACVERHSNAITSTVSPSIGFACVDSAGTGVAVIIYNNPLAVLVIKVTTYSTYGGSFTQGTARQGNTQIAISDHKLWFRLRKSGTSYFGSFSLDGELWSEETAAMTSTHTVDRVGWFLAPLGTIPSYIDIDWFNKL